MYMAKYWYALHSHPQKEEALFQQLTYTNIEAFYPKLPAHPVNPRARKVVPYFPGYLFVKADLNETATIIFQRMPHAVGLVSFDGEAAIVPENIIYAIRRHVDEIVKNEDEFFQKLKRGDSIVISSGPFAQYPAIFDVRLSGNARVRVLLKMLSGRNLSLDLHADQIKKP
jgi:transcriptional antiterminator RfaH